MAVGSDNTNKRAANNRQVENAAHKALNELLAELAKPEFTGSVTLEINAQKGFFGRIRKATNSYVH